MRCDGIYDHHDTSATLHMLRSEKQTCGHTILKISEKKQVYTRVKVICHI